MGGMIAGFPPWIRFRASWILILLSVMTEATSDLLSSSWSNTMRENLSCWSTDILSIWIRFSRCFMRGAGVMFRRKLLPVVFLEKTVVVLCMLKGEIDLLPTTKLFWWFLGDIENADLSVCIIFTFGSSPDLLVYSSVSLTEYFLSSSTLLLPPISNVEFSKAFWSFLERKATLTS